ncbi:hypothetical protein HDU98_007803 [Podochytrium sp. JEL0797]|nr:hypothetical protein HDU98_007803 [Podochytrium sp. JEL0797]
MSDEKNTVNVIDAEETVEKTSDFYATILPVAACGVGLFSDGYVNSCIGSVKTVLALQYGSLWKKSTAKTYLGDIAFLGVFVGMLVFGYMSDKWSRTNTLMLSTSILILFTLAATCSYSGSDPSGMFTMLIAFRFFVGIGVGGEYPCGSAAAAEAAKGLKSGTRHTWLAMVTNVAIDWGFVIGALVPYILTVASSNYDVIWRTSLGVGIIFPSILLYMRSKLQEPEEFKENSMRNAKTPYSLVLKFYGGRLFAIASIWFLYDFVTYSFDIYASTILSNIFSDDAPLTTVFGWNTVINLFYIPGAMLGAPLSDKYGPRKVLYIGVFVQALLGFAMAFAYESLSKPSMVGLFSVLYGIFLSLGELGPGNNIIILASSTSATGIRGQYYGIAAAVGKLGAFIGTFVFPYIVAAGGDNDVLSAQYPFYVAGSLCIVAAGIAYFFVPEVSQDMIAEEDVRFRAFLVENGYDVSQLGLKAEAEVL